MARRDTTLRKAFRMPAASSLSALTLRVRDLEAALSFYADRLGLAVVQRDGPRVDLAPAGRSFGLELVHVPQAPPRLHPSIGLYHFALLLPDRAALAAVIRRLLESRWPVDGASDHGVSEAFYLRDPEGNGIELYWDRPRERWSVGPDGVEMMTAPLDVAELLNEAEAAGPLSPTTRFGHVHLHVVALDEGERFYADGLGLDVMQRSYPGALFLSTGGYHHHVGLNTWAGGRRSPDGSTGLIRYAWAVPAGTLAQLGPHLRDRGVPFGDAAAGIAVTDPAGVQVDLLEV